jgi:hypothetical protein
MDLKRVAPTLAAMACLGLVAPLGAQAKPDARASGDPVATNPAVVGVPIARTGKALDQAASLIEAGKGASAVAPLRATRRYLIRSYRGAKYLIENAPPPAEDARAARRFKRLARRVVRAARRGGSGGWIRAQASGDPGPILADGPTAVFNVLTSQYEAATTAIGMLPDTKGNLQNRVGTVLRTAVVLRNRVVKLAHAATPPPEEDAAAAQDADDAATFDVVMPGLVLLLNDEIQQIQATLQDGSAASAASVLNTVLSADVTILGRVNLWWPPAED